MDNSANVLTKAQASNLESVTVIGYDQNGDFYFDSSAPDRESLIADLELAKNRLLAVELPHSGSLLRR